MAKQNVVQAKDDEVLVFLSANAEGGRETSLILLPGESGEDPDSVEGKAISWLDEESLAFISKFDDEGRKALMVIIDAVAVSVGNLY